MKTFLFWLSRKINYPLIPPEVIQISLTYRCNLRCKMCSIANLLPKEQELSLDQIFHIIDEANNYGIKEVILTGGEPFLREDLFEIAGYCRIKGLKSIVTTNGTLINDDMAESINKSKIDHIHISLDGLEGTNDYFRGQGAFSKIINGIQLLDEKRKNGNFFSLGIGCTVMSENVNELYELLELSDNLNIDSINFQPLLKDNANFADKQEPLFWIKDEDIPVLRRESSKIKNYKPKHIKVYEEPRLKLLIDYYQNQLKRKDWVCFGGFKTVFICFDKNKPLVYSCHGICGNLNEVSLKKAWISREAKELRIHSGRCKNLCMQSCYSREVSSSLKNVLGLQNRKGQ